MHGGKLSILVVDTSSDISEQLRRLFPPPEAEVLRQPRVGAVMEMFETRTFDVLVIAGSAYKRDESSGADLLEMVAAESPATQVLFLVRPEDIRIAISGLRAGSYHYTRLPVSDEELRLLVLTALERRPIYAGNSILRRRRGEDRLDELLGQAPAMQVAYAEIRQAAASDIPVLILGETGTGKDLAAQAIHRNGPRCEGPYIPVHLSALPPELVASELFGHERGAFTGALERREGVFERGHKGTVFLDEIGTVDEKVQLSLLRLIEQKKFTRLGGRKTLSTDVRLVAATNENLAEAARAGTFREDLYYRLDVFRIVMPALRERSGDIPLLTQTFVQRYSEAYQKNILDVSQDFVAILEGYSWPGNVRELKNVIQRAVLVCAGESLLPEHLPPRFQKHAGNRPKITFDIGTPLDEVERQMVLGALTTARNNRKRAAELLGISRRALYNKFRKHGIP